MSAGDDRAATEFAALSREERTAVRLLAHEERKRRAAARADELRAQGMNGLAAALQAFEETRPPEPPATRRDPFEGLRRLERQARIAWVLCAIPFGIVAGLLIAAALGVKHL